jgi:hypothetical protein
MVHKRYHFANWLRNWTAQQRMRVLFSEECSVERGASHMQIYFFRSASQQRNSDEVTTYKKSRDIRVIV